MCGPGVTRSHPPHDTLPEDTFTLAEGGYVIVALPEALSKTEYEELRDWLELMQRKAERKVVEQLPPPGGASSSSEAADPEGSSGDDADSLSWE